jgi:hypothetical protein
MCWWACLTLWRTTMERVVGAYDVGSPYPALTPAQRYHLDVFGYVIVENTLSRGEIEVLLEVLRQLKRDVWEGRAGADLFVKVRTPHQITVERVEEYHPSIVEYLAHPLLVGIAEELTGGRSGSIVQR